MPFVTAPRALSLTAVLALLSACGSTGGALNGGSTAADALDPNSRDRLTYAEIAEVAKDVNDGYNAVSITPKAQVPTAGTADYYGAVGGTLSVAGQNTRVGGLMGLGVNFGTNRVGGRLGNFVTARGDRLDGTLAVTNGVLNRTSNSSQVAIFGDVDGVLQSQANERIVVDARLRESGFKGPNVDYIGGSIEGDVRVNGIAGDIDMRAQLQR